MRVQWDWQLVESLFDWLWRCDTLQRSSYMKMTQTNVLCWLMKLWLISNVTTKQSVYVSVSHANLVIYTVSKKYCTFSIAAYISGVTRFLLISLENTDSVLKPRKGCRNPENPRLALQSTSSGYAGRLAELYTLTPLNMIGDRCFCLCTGNLFPGILYTSTLLSSYQVDQPQNVHKIILNCDNRPCFCILFNSKYPLFGRRPFGKQQCAYIYVTSQHLCKVY